MRISSKRTGVGAVISALLMVAIAVSLSVALFVSTTGYLSGLTGSIGNTQPGQNQAAQALLAVESTTSKAFSTGFPTDGYVVLYVRNVGGVAITIGSLTVTAPPTNGGQTKSFSSVPTVSTLTWSSPYSGLRICSEPTTGSTCDTAATCSSSVQPSTLVKLTSQVNTARIWIAWCGSGSPAGAASPAPHSGDAFQIQITSTVGASNIITINVP